MSNKLLLIGIDKYTNHKELYTCAKDVIDFKNALLEKYDFIEGDVYELINEKATNKKIQDALSGYVKTLNEEDNLVIFFSGHGSYNVAEERGFWIPVDATKEYTTWIPNETIITLINKIKCKHIFLISDSCFSNSLLLQDTAKAVLELSNRPSRWVLTSAFEESYSPTDPNSNSLFAEAIINFLEESSSDFRVSRLIEHVKDIFSVNDLQQPQGYPMKMHGHRGGEIIFSIRNDADDRAFRGYKNFIEVLNLYKRNASFELVLEHEDKVNKIGFKLYKELDPIVKRLTFYLYLFSGIIQNKTKKYLEEKVPTLFNNNFIIFLPKEIDQKNIGKRKDNFKAKFKPLNIFYIDEFIRTACTPKFIESESNPQFLQISNFIQPSYYNKSNLNIIALIDRWQFSLSEPILVIKGVGGIGKTTFAQFVVDKIIANSSSTTVLFIDSMKIKDSLIKRSRNLNKFSIYNFYEALFEQNDIQEDKLSEAVFRLNLDAGNIFLVIDGLDEIISKIPNFDIDSFLKSIAETSNELGGGKVIITCRTHFWKQKDEEIDQFEVIELKPFNKTQATEFFLKSFDLEKKRKKAMKLADEFQFSEPSEIEILYHPYVLDIIRSIIELENDSIDLDLTRFSSSLLNSSIKNDYIIYRVCDRECKRIGQISIDEQLKFFIHLAIERRGSIYSSNFKKEIELALGREIDSVSIEAFKSHPFLQCNSSFYMFRYDFFLDVFKGLYIAKILNSKSEIELSNVFIDIISESCWFDSGLNIEIVRRINEWTELELLLFSDLIDKIKLNGSINLEKKREVIANIFNIALLINQRFSSNDVESNTTLLRAIFEKDKDQIFNLSIINLNTEKKIRFNFSNLKIHEAYINGYNSFYECDINPDTTRFFNSHILNINSERDSRKLPKYMFLDCIYDQNIADSINDFNEEHKSNIDKSKAFLNSYFHLFYSNGRLGRQWEEKVIKPRFKGVDKYNFGYKNVMKILKKNDVIESAEEKEGIKLFVNEKHKSEVIKYVKDGTISPILSLLIKEFSEL